MIYLLPHAGVNESILSVSWSLSGDHLSIVTPSSLLMVSPLAMASVRVVSQVAVHAPVHYSEHVWQDDTCVWWSPGSQDTLAFLTWDTDEVANINIASTTNVVSPSTGLNMR